MHLMATKPTNAKPKAAKVTAAPPRVAVELLKAFSLASAPGVVRWVEGRGVPKATVSVQGTKISGTTDVNGVVHLPIVGVASGRVLDIQPASSQVSSGPASTGHGTGGANAPAFQFRPFQVTVDTDANGFVPGSAKITLTPVPGSPPHALLLSLTKDKLSLDWKPDFVKTANRKLVATKTNNVLVLHRTGGNTIRNAINTFLNPNTKGKASPQYVVDVDGFVVKLAHESDICNHAGTAFWKGATNINATSVGIEIINGGAVLYTQAQYDSVLRLVREIRAAFPTITRQNVVGHMDVATEKTQAISRTRRIDDPGELFERDQLETAGLVRRRVVSVPNATVFGIGPGEFAEQAKSSPKTLKPDFKGIQKALSDIGYSVATNGTTISGVFDTPLTNAVRVFQRRYFSGGNAASKGAKFDLGRIDFETAFAIEQVSQDTLP
jgi:N-acetyl-anhydromuramyl-L-alanine amidase AmpD